PAFVLIASLAASPALAQQVVVNQGENQALPSGTPINGVRVNGGSVTGTDVDIDQSTGSPPQGISIFGGSATITGGTIDQATTTTKYTSGVAVQSADRNDPDAQAGIATIND